MLLQQKCPICEGHGIVVGGFYTTPPGCDGVSFSATEECKNCSGSGVVTCIATNKTEINYE